MKVIIIVCVFTFSFLLSSCIENVVILPTSQVSYYHKEHFFGNVAFNGPSLDERLLGNLSFETHFWIDKNQGSDVGVKLSSFSAPTRSWWYTLMTFYRKWFLIDEYVTIGNTGVGGIFEFGNDRENDVILGGIEGFLSVGFFDRNVSLSWTSRIGIGIARLEKNQTEYFPIWFYYFGSGPQLVVNFGFDNVGVGFGVGIQPLIGWDFSSYIFHESPTKLLLVSSIFDFSMNVKF